MHSIENKDISPDYQKGRDYFVDVSIDNTQGSSQILRFYFRDIHGNLIGYIRMSDTAFDEDQRTFYIIDTISAYKLEKHTSERGSEYKMMIENGFKRGLGLRDFGSTMMQEVLEYAQKLYPDKSKHVKMVSYDRNRKYTEELVRKTKERTSGIIGKQYGGNEEYTCSFVLI